MYTVDVVNQNQHPLPISGYGDIISLGKKHQRQHDANFSGQAGATQKSVTRPP
jgi:hypothetical protein